MNSDENTEKKSIQDRVVDKMVEEWDQVKCCYCGLQISMLEARLVENGQYFACKGGCK